MNPVQLPGGWLLVWNGEAPIDIGNGQTFMGFVMQARPLGNMDRIVQVIGATQKEAAEELAKWVGRIAAAPLN